MSRKHYGYASRKGNKPEPAWRPTGAELISLSGRLGPRFKLRHARKLAGYRWGTPSKAYPLPRAS